MFETLIGESAEPQFILAVAKFASAVRMEDESWKELSLDIKASYRRRVIERPENISCLNVDILYSIVRLFQDVKYFILNEIDKKIEFIKEVCLEILDISEKEVVEMIRQCSIITMLRTEGILEKKILYIDEIVEEHRTYEYSILSFILAYLLLADYVRGLYGEWDQETINYLMEFISDVPESIEIDSLKFMNIL